MLIAPVFHYLFHPLLGGILALLFFLAIGAGLVVGQTVTDTFRVAAISGLVGLFSAQATLKLKELVETIFTTRSDPRSDPLRTSQAQSSAPRIGSITPLTIPHGASPIPSLNIAGSNFVSGCKVKGEQRGPGDYFFQSGQADRQSRRDRHRLSHHPQNRRPQSEWRNFQ